MKKSHFIQIFLLLSLIAVNVVSYALLNQRSDDVYEAQLRKAWEAGHIDDLVLRVDDIYDLIEEAGETKLYSTEEAPQNTGPVCDVEPQAEEVDLSAELIDIKLPKKYYENEFIKLKVTLKNTGNTTWYGEDHPCEAYAKTRLGNVLEPEIQHSLWNDFNFIENNWLHNEFKNRIAMNEQEVVPGGKGTFNFWIETPLMTASSEVEIIKGENDEERKKVRRYLWAYEKHTLNPVIGETWLELDIPLEFEIGLLPEKEVEKVGFLELNQKNYSLKDFRGEKNVYITLKDQKGYLRYGDQPFHEYIVSSGGWDTPTPIGDHVIYNKQELRVGGKLPHYRMPYWVGLNINGEGFTGYGLHEVPYLGLSREDSEFYKQGLHHDLGRNVSHGCVRSAPENAELVYKFGDIGTSVYVRKGLEEEIPSSAMASVRRAYN
ncbi:L,D-transpeptidase [Candidatus Peregrinibacteria bacterium]|jgi:hypothetical protein|nr:L,D-transpeptidase [Candidatus Peregrinibacteria bacterium]